MAFLRMTENSIDRLAVVGAENPGVIVGIIARGDIARAYDHSLKAMLREL